MNPVLIYTDTERINKEKSLLDKHVTFFQASYNAFKAIGITPTIPELNSLNSWVSNGGNYTNALQQYTIDKLMAIAGNYTYNGVALSQQTLRSQLAIPDLTAVTNSLLAVRNFGGFDAVGTGARINLLTLNADVISKVADSNAQIEAIYTYYTKTDASAQLATDLQTVCNALNAFNTTYQSNQLVKKYGNGHLGKVTIIPGIDVIAGVCVPGLIYIRSFEAMMAN